MVICQLGFRRLNSQIHHLTQAKFHWQSMKSRHSFTLKLQICRAMLRRMYYLPNRQSNNGSTTKHRCRWLPVTDHLLRPFVKMSPRIQTNHPLQVSIHSQGARVIDFRSFRSYPALTTSHGDAQSHSQEHSLVFSSNLRSTFILFVSTLEYFTRRSRRRRGRFLVVMRTPISFQASPID